MTRIPAIAGAAAAVVVLSEPHRHDRCGRPEPPTTKVARIVAVGDIACDPDSPYIGVEGYCQHRKVGRLVKGMVNRGADWFFTLGDAQYEYGQYRDYLAEFDPAFKAVRPVTKAVAGNHEYYTDKARGHFRYWGGHAGSPQQPWRTFTPVKGWRVVMLDSNCEHVGGCGAKSGRASGCGMCSLPTPGRARLRCGTIHCTRRASMREARTRRLAHAPVAYEQPWRR